MVPQEYIGVWKRTLLKTKRGTHDTISEAYWLQTEDLHSDLRIPTQALAVESKCLSECSEDELSALASQYAFAGHTQVQPSVRLGMLFCGIEYIISIPSAQEVLKTILSTPALPSWGVCHHPGGGGPGHMVQGNRL